MKLIVCSALALALVPGVAGTQEAAVEEASSEPESYTLHETVDVDLVTVPFYAVDGDGNPVYDLEPDEIELWVNGERVSPDYFDRYGAAEPVLVRRSVPRGESEAAEGAEAVGDRLLPPTLPRHVFFLFDQAFSTPRGLMLNRETASRLAESLPSTDWLYLVRYHTQEGFEQELGPLPADAAGKAALTERLQALTPNVERVRRRSPLPTINHGKIFPSDNLEDAYGDIHKTEQANYGAEARSLADSLEYLATFLRQLKGPKLLLLFSQGMDSRLYTDGLEGRFPPIRLAFEKPLKALGETGTMILYVNAEAHADGALGEASEFAVDEEATFINALPTGETTLQEMSEVSGGRVFQHTNVETLRDRIVDWTSAYYELGYYPEPAAAAAASAGMELRVTRPGVEVWTPKWVKLRREYRDLSQKEKRFLITDLILHGPEAVALNEVATSRFTRLDGRFGGRAEEAARRLTFEARWPASVLFKALDLYSVVLEPSVGMETGKLMDFQGGVFSPGAETSVFDVTVPREGNVVWGIVAVDAADGTIYFRRMLVHPQPVTAAGATGEVGR